MRRPRSDDIPAIVVMQGRAASQGMWAPPEAERQETDSPGRGRVRGGSGGTSLAHTWTPARRERLWTSDLQNGKKIHLCSSQPLSTCRLLQQPRRNQGRLTRPWEGSCRPHPSAHHCWPQVDRSRAKLPLGAIARHSETRPPGLSFSQCIPSRGGKTGVTQQCWASPYFPKKKKIIWRC